MGAPRFLTKPGVCAMCREPMAAGEAFVWHEGSRSVACYPRSHTGAPMSGHIEKRTTWKPRHPHDCYAAKVAASQRALAEQEYLDTLEYCRGRGFTLQPGEAEALRAATYAKRGLEVPA